MSAPHGTGTPILVARGLSVFHGREATLRGVTLPDLAPGRIMGVIGPNASGKSTLLRGIAGELRSTGEILIEGRPLAALPPVARRACISYLPQSLPQPSALTPYELARAFGETVMTDLSARARDARIEAAFAALDLLAYALRPLRELSGGKRQLVGFALATLRAPRLLLLDEPTSALDLRWQFGLMAQARRIVTQTGCACLIALHDLGMALRCCDLVVLLEEGRLVAAGAPETVITAEILRAVYGIEAEITPGGREGPPLLAIRGPAVS
jgi:iron complex transport system ATP-binding protein